MKFTFIQKSIVATVGAVALLGSTAGAGHAWTFGSGVSAGDTLSTATALAPFDPGNNTVNGRLQANANADLFKFVVSTAGTFDAQTFIRTGTGINLGNPQLFLFDSLGKGIIANDNISATNSQSKITQLLNAGTYYLGISSFDRDPNSGGTLIFDNNGNVANSGALSGWSNVNNLGIAGGRYGIKLSFEAAKVPSPALLPGLAALGFGAIRKRKAKAAVA
jgi:Bacterial pre-peptidase C-terminal domain